MEKHVQKKEPWRMSDAEWWKRVEIDKVSLPHSNIYIIDPTWWNYAFFASRFCQRSNSRPCESHAISLFPSFLLHFWRTHNEAQHETNCPRKKRRRRENMLPLSPCWRITWTLLTSQTKQSTTQKQDRKYMETLLHPTKTTFSHSLLEFPELANASIANCALYLRPCTYV